MSYTVTITENTPVSDHTSAVRDVDRDRKEVYRQTVETLDLLALINQINKKPRKPRERKPAKVQP